MTTTGVGRNDAVSAGGAAVAVHFAWGLNGARHLAEELRCEVIAVLDVLSFTTTVTVAAERGIAIAPAAPDDADELASLLPGAIGAAPVREGTPARPWSLSPSRMLAAPIAPLVVLGSPNGAAISAAAAGSGAPPGATLVAASLRCVSAAARLLVSFAAEDGARRLGVVAAGERWPDGSLRPAAEDLAGAGALLDRIERAAATARVAVTLDDDARLASGAIAGRGDEEIAALVRDSMSAAELVHRGDAADVDLACAIDATGVVPVRRPGEAAYAPWPA